TKISIFSIFISYKNSSVFYHFYSVTSHSLLKNQGILNDCLIAALSRPAATLGLQEQENH
ncbi:hypothetical protein, partial [Serratia marcescens]|uniref:hypothetical protein n=1 Tax=Serratia marcescens TaxID=615 RepID=UPI003B840E48